MTVKNDFYADRLLRKLDVSDPFYAAFEAQDVSRNVGFDFSSFQDVVDRALDEIRETKEAYFDSGEDAKAHFGDELADIMFSVINIYRHADLKDPPSLHVIRNDATKQRANDTETMQLIDDIGTLIKHTATIAENHPKDLQKSAQELFDTGTQNYIVLAQRNGFDPTVLLKENVRKYLLRCQAVEKLASEEHKCWADLAHNNEIVKYWQKAKTNLK
jgi:uncharacterized protein YabN with tetrapyrrole methylase and pyrophosphatase domain